VFTGRLQQKAVNFSPQERGFKDKGECAERVNKPRSDYN